jgi:hypothetical protein
MPRSFSVSEDVIELTEEEREVVVVVFVDFAGHLMDEGEVEEGDLRVRNLGKKDRAPIG